jgi:hypothetical protein
LQCGGGKSGRGGSCISEKSGRIEGQGFVADL